MMTVVIDNPVVETYFHHSQCEITSFLESVVQEEEHSFVVTSIEEVYRRIEEARKSEEWIEHQNFWEEFELESKA